MGRWTGSKVAGPHATDFGQRLITASKIPKNVFGY
jgi:hypothetical protein